MTPEAAIGALDRQLAIHGEDILLRRETKGAGTLLIPFDCGVRAKVRDYTAAELVGELQQGDSQVILSPSEMTDRQWPAPPRKGDKVVIKGKVRAVMNVVPFDIGGTVARYELSVRG